MLKLFFVLHIIMISSKLFAHARWTLDGAVTPRSTSSGIKTGPCGGIARTATSKVFQAGSTITVQWEETINHPGRFEFYFSPANDANFVLLKTVPDILNVGVGTTTLDLPNIACTACTLQLIQVMTENPASPSLYYSCADIELTATPGGGPSPPPVQTPVPAPTPVCK